MKSCDPTINRPVPSTGQRPLQKVEPPRPWPDPPPFAPVKCDHCGHTHNLHGDCVADLALAMAPSGIRGGTPRTEQLAGQPKFNSLHISHLPLKVDGHIEHLFVAILNGEAVGQVLAKKQEWGACGLRMLYVAQKHRHMGIETRLVSRACAFAHNEHCTSVEIAVMKCNVEGRKFWIRRRFIDAEGPDRAPSPEYQCMTKAI